MKPYSQYAQFAAVLLVISVQAVAADRIGLDEEVAARASARASNYLKSSQNEDGSWSDKNEPGISGLVVYALLEAGNSPDDRSVAKGLKHLESFIQPDGGIYHPETTHKNYETAICVLAFVAANEDGRYDSTIVGAEKALRGVQWGADGSLERSDPAFGGAGYGRHQRPDLSNTQYFLEGLKAAGVASDDPAIQNALIFISRCQNLEGEHNTTPFAAKVNDGGSYYTPAAGGDVSGGSHSQRRFALVWKHDLRRAEKHDLCRAYSR